MTVVVHKLEIKADIKEEVNADVKEEVEAEVKQAQWKVNMDQHRYHAGIMCIHQMRNSAKLMMEREK